jgi:hypothetical protein
MKFRNFKMVGWFTDGKKLQYYIQIEHIKVILESESGVGDFVICLEIKPCFNAYKLVRSFKVSAKNSLTFVIQSMEPVEYFTLTCNDMIIIQI